MCARVCVRVSVCAKVLYLHDEVEVRLEQGEHDLRLRVTHPAVILQQLGAVLGEHEPREQYADVPSMCMVRV